MTMIADTGTSAALSRSIARRHIATITVADDANDVHFPLPGARLEATNVVPGEGQIRTVVRISTGPGITDYVTHEAEFAYSTYGIHVGQDDRLTFFGDEQQIAVHLIDCREDSDQLGNEITIKLKASPHRVLIIPKGVAHTLDGLAGVVTRDEPVWYADANPDWSPDNDLVSFLRSSADAPVVQTNRHQLPVAAHLLISGMSQKTNAAVRGAYASRYRVNVGGEVTYVTVRPDWRAEEAALDPSGPIRRNNFVLTGPESFTIVPSTDSCTSDVVEMDLDRPGDRFVKHDYSRRRLTWLAGSTDAAIDIVSEQGEHTTLPLGDPTIGVLIPPGTWYRIQGTGRIWLRCELELLDTDVSQLEHPLGADAVTADASTIQPSRAAQESDCYLPGPALHALARLEAQALAGTTR